MTDHDDPHFLLLEGLRRNITQRLPLLTGRVMLGRETPIKKAECPRMCVEFLTDRTSASSGNRARRIKIASNIQIVRFMWIEDSAGAEERMLREYWTTYRAIRGTLRDMTLGTNCPDGLLVHEAGEILGATADIPVNCRDRSVMYAYNLPNLTFESNLGED